MNLKGIRCDLHKIPELGRSEFKTRDYILNTASNLNCKILRPTETSIVLFFDLKKESTICFRADMDALPIEEENDVEYKSQNIGVMHACGHDGHMAMLLGFAIWASENVDKLNNNIVCLFQPSEEDNAGANDIIASNVLDDLKIDAIFGMHIWPNLEEGKLYSMAGGMLATSCEVTLDIKGKSVHAANRDLVPDSMLYAMNLVTSFYDFCSKIKERHLINFGKFESGTVRNAVAANAHLEASMRCFDDATFNLMKNELERLTKEVEKSGLKVELKLNAAYPSVINSSKLFNKYKNNLDLIELNAPFMQAEDFGVYTRKYDSLFVLLGCGNTNLLHTSKFDFNMDILEKGLDLYKYLATNKYLK